MATSLNPDFTSQLASYRQQIDAAMADYFKSARARLDINLIGYEQQAFNYLKDFCLRPGKRVRGALTLFAYHQLSKKPQKSIINAALAVEMVQNYLLIIDDVMDRSKSRRGKPTVHEMIKSTANFNGQAEQFSNMMAINVGLLAMHMANWLLTEAGERPANIVAALKLFESNIAKTVYGQVDDLFNHHQMPADEASIIRLYQYKNSYYTFVNPLQMGAALAGVSDQKVLEAIRAFGLPAGVAFQLHDDVLGLFGDQQATGKSANDDLREGKYTLLMLYTLERAAKADAAKVKATLGNPNLTEADSQAIRAIVEKCGARKAVEDRARVYTAKTKDQLAACSFFSPPGQQFLKDLVDFSVNRKA